MDIFDGLDNICNPSYYDQIGNLINPGEFEHIGNLVMIDDFDKIFQEFNFEKIFHESMKNFKENKTDNIKTQIKKSQRIKKNKPVTKIEQHQPNRKIYNKALSDNYIELLYTLLQKKIISIEKINSRCKYMIVCINKIAQLKLYMTRSKFYGTIHAFKRNINYAGISCVTYETSKRRIITTNFISDTICEQKAKLFDLLNKAKSNRQINK
jgi:hypothetical protein